MLDFISNHYENDEKFNDDFILSKGQDNVLTYVDDICEALEVINGVEYLGSSIETDESKLRTRSTDKQKWIPLSDTRLVMIKIKFRIFTRTKSEIVEKELLYPKIIDDQFFILNGTKYTPLYQIIDSSTYHTPNSLTLKTLLMPIVITNKKSSFEDENENVYEGRTFIINLFRGKINILEYYLAKFGFEKTIEYFGFSDIFQIRDNDEEYNEPEFTKINLNSKIHMLIHNETLESSEQFHLDFINTFIDLITNRTTIENIYAPNYWKRKLGSEFNKNSAGQLNKCEQILVSFERLLDDNTKRTLRIDPRHKEDIFSIIRWMLVNHDDLKMKNNMDLNHKRIRLHEYLLNPLLRRFSTDTYRLLNSRSVTIGRLAQLFNTLGPGFLVRRLLKSNVSNSTSNLMRQYTAVNEMHLFSSALKVSFRGPQSISESGDVSDFYRGLHPSYLGRIGLSASSNSDPGLTGTFVPFIETDGFYFSHDHEDYDNEHLIPQDVDVSMYETERKDNFDENE